MSAPSRIKEFFVDPSRLASGTYCHQRDRQIGEGDINASYSCDKIALEGSVRSPFKWQNTLWVCTSGGPESLSPQLAWSLLMATHAWGTLMEVFMMHF